MTSYLLRRLLQLIPISLGLATLIFVLIHLSPGDPARLMLGPRATSEQLARLRSYMHENDPLWTQFVAYIAHLAQGDLGTSIYFQSPVTELLGSRLPTTLLLAFCSILLSVVVALPLAVLSATHRGGWIDQGVRLVTLVGFAMPSYWLALLLMLLFGLKLRVLPIAGYGTGLGDHLFHLIMPSAVIAFSVFPLLVRTLRIGVLEVQRQDYVRTARAKGLPGRIVLYKHVLRNALLPTITVVGLNLGALLGGTVIIESVFALPGVGYLLTSSVNNRDYPAVQGAALVLAMLFVLVNLLADVTYSLVDPRIRRG